jgi:hypothetical protein
MWQGKPVSEWTEKQQAIFLNHLTGHTFTHHYYFHTDSGFFAVKSFMEKELPDVWEGYLSDTVQREFYYDGYDRYTTTFNAQLNLTNLITFLLDNQEGWAWKECTACTGKDKPINCNGGKIKHPALLFAEGVK